MLGTVDVSLLFFPALLPQHTFSQCPRSVGTNVVNPNAVFRTPWFKTGISSFVDARQCDMHIV